MNMTLMRSKIEEVTDFIELATSLGADMYSCGTLIVGSVKK
jgi:MoaA/NifB/PqqE/SkfB family radical SAM enzyme